MRFSLLSGLTRRSLFGAGFLGTGALFGSLLPKAIAAQKPKAPGRPLPDSTGTSAPLVMHGGSTTIGDVDHDRNGFDPRAILTDWDAGTVSKLPDGQTLREYKITVEEREIEIAPGVSYPALDL
ncbi:hypothetical protein K9N68_01575 [Kovacikia minuta CCNUW1]|uniref:hypothetical protein n=1 Tax=Kovacikia minuta TaxID=2931930 RepID=UPI001CCBD3DB|nr:hypothetical protein K9N68_01575 [Kovacikia minuta CCNUW1]